ncbi:MAG: hypothetical protein COU69_01585 [Candidatus Pacebacteria bacterium CG10_big_fil_rev_8_21_14_0_10_56_10]|nr:MAG: hypothetical protein COU69_01585 [Candidatus Pacebacteria bacterium CG10_big_fil_rev_8_21_14_0_10_56_10]
MSKAEQLTGQPPPSSLEHDWLESENTHREPPLPINGLLYPVDLDDRRVVKAFESVVDKVISEVGGLPAKIETVQVDDPRSGFPIPRIVIGFRVDELDAEQLAQLEEVAVRVYGDDVRGTKTRQGKAAKTHFYPKLDAGRGEKPSLDSTIGWYLGTETGTPNRSYLGIFVYRHIGKTDIAAGVAARKDGDWFTEKTLTDNTGQTYQGGSYIIEIRESGKYTDPNGGVVNSGLYQTDLAELAIYVSMVLTGKKLPPVRPGLTYRIYHRMNQIGLGPDTELPGLEPQLRLVEKTMILPLASPELTEALGGTPKSMGLIGQVGTGKTQIIKHFLRQNNGIMMVPVSAYDLETELHKAMERRRILPRVRDIAVKVEKPVVLVIEDLEFLANSDNEASNLLLNELAGIHNSGYRVLWTTNHLEKINPQLLEPERLGGGLVFCGLPTAAARKLILDQHLVVASRTKELPLFNQVTIGGTSISSSEARDKLLQALAELTEGFTPRFLKDIVVEAIGNFMLRISLEKCRLDGLTELDLEGQGFNVGDWDEALQKVRRSYDVESRIREDERLRKLTLPGSGGSRSKLGFPQTAEGNDDDGSTLASQLLRVAASVD